MKQFGRAMLIVVSLGMLARPSLAQQVTTEMIGSFSGSLTVNFPPSPCSVQTDNVAFTGSINVVATVDPAANTVDYHVNLLGVKGIGALAGKYVGNGATDWLDQTFPGANITFLSRSAPTYSPPTRAGFPSTGALPVVITVNFGTDFTLNAVSASVGKPSS